MLKYLCLALALAMSAVGCAAESQDEPEAFVLDSDYMVELTIVETTCSFATIGASIDVDLHIDTSADSLVIRADFANQGTTVFVGEQNDDSFVSSFIVANDLRVVNNTLKGSDFANKPLVELTQQLTQDKKTKECYTIYSGLAQ